MTVESLECLNCGETYPPSVCRWRCPACGFKDLQNEPADGQLKGRRFKEMVSRHIDEFLE